MRVFVVEVSGPNGTRWPLVCFDSFEEARQWAYESDYKTWNVTEHEVER